MSFSQDYYKVFNYYLLSQKPWSNFTFRKVLYYEDFSLEQVHAYIAEAIQSNKNFYELDCEEIRNVLEKCNKVKNIIDDDNSIGEKINNLLNIVNIMDISHLKEDFERQAINQNEIQNLEREDEDKAELDEIEKDRMCAIELMTIVGCKGLSADHVMVIGFDDINMKRVTKNAFYVAITRARKSLHIITSLKSGGSTEAHSFLHSLPDIHTNYFKYKKSTHSTEQLDNKQNFIKYLRSIRTGGFRKRSI